jgi:hypothetical protein
VLFFQILSRLLCDGRILVKSNGTKLELDPSGEINITNLAASLGNFFVNVPIKAWHICL